MVENKLVGGRKTYTRQQKRLVFYVLMFALPLLQFLLFYLYVNFSSISIAFQQKTILEGQNGFEITPTLDHFKEAFKYFFGSECGKMIGNSLQLLACQLIIVMPLALLFSYYIAKERPGASFFRAMLYLPQVISLVVLGILFKYVANEVVPFVAEEYFEKEVIGLLTVKGNTNETRFYTAMVFTLWFSFGANVLIYTGAMSGIDQSIVESAQLDGVTNLQEFWYIYVPMIFSTITTFILTGIAGIFNNQMNLYTFYGYDSEGVDVFGYYFYKETAKQLAASAASPKLATEAAFAEIAELAALGLIATLILVPTTLIVRKLLNKYGPKAE